jgi:hypothetical protein
MSFLNLNYKSFDVFKFRTKLFVRIIILSVKILPKNTGSTISKHHSIGINHWNYNKNCCLS